MIKITADSTCDLSIDILRDLDITLVPLHITVGEQTYRDGVDITPTDIFHYVDVEGKICQTSAVNIYEYEHIFNELAPKYEAIIHICLGSGFSSSYQNATIAARNFKNVYVLDSQNLSTGSGHLVYEAALMAKEGVDAQTICRSLGELIPKVDASFVIDQLDYLYKGGRCSGLQAFGSKVMQIRPCIEVVDGKMKVGKKYRGSFENSLRRYVRDRIHDEQKIDFRRVFITHPMCSKETVEMVKEILSDDGRFEEIIETSAGCTISSHCGPNTLGILFIRKEDKGSIIL